jgi:hypothetical protein
MRGKGDVIQKQKDVGQSSDRMKVTGKCSRTIESKWALKAR